MTRRLLRFPIAEPLETALVAATELDRAQLEQLRDQVAALLEALPPPPAPAPAGKARPDRSPYLAGLPEGPRGGGAIEWKWHRQGNHRYGPYPYLRLRLGGRQRSIYLRALAQATRAAATSDGQVNPSA
jgi:hypothetical protein